MFSVAWLAARRHRVGARVAIGVGALLASALSVAGETRLDVGAGADRGRVDCVATPGASAATKLFVGHTFGSGIELQALTFGADPRLGGDNSWAFAAVGVKQLVLMSDHQLIKATLP